MTYPPKKPTAVVALTCCVCGLSWLCSASGAEATPAKVAFVAEGYLANRESFKGFECRFSFAEATADSVDDALQGRLKKQQEITGVWIVNDGNVKYSLLVDAETAQRTMEDAKKHHPPASAGTGPMNLLPLPPYLGCEVLKYRGHAMHHGVLAANVFSLEDRPEPFEIDRTPWSMHIMGPEECFNPGAKIKGYLAHHPDRLEFLGTRRIDGVDTMAISIRVISEPQQITEEYDFDPSRGFLPIVIKRTETSTGRVSRLAKILKVKRCSGDRWFPTESVLLYDPEKKGTDIRLERFEVLELDADNRPADDQFFLDLPDKTEINISNKEGPYYIHLGSSRRILGTELEAFYNDTLEAGERRLAQRAAMTGQPYQGGQTGSYRLWIIAACVLAVLATVVCVIIVRRRRYAH